MNDARLRIPAPVTTASRLALLSVGLLAATCHLGAARDAPAADDVVVEERPAHWAAIPNVGRPLVDFDLEAACAENARKREAKQPYNYSCFLLRSYADAYHAGTTFTWRRPARGAFRFVGTTKSEDGLLDEVSVGWQSFADGLQWGFHEVRRTRRAGDDPFAVVAEAAARDRIRAAVGPEPAGRPCDVFLERTREVFTDQRAGDVAFPPAAYGGERYGVCVDGTVRFFTPSGAPIQDKPRPQ